MAGDLFYRVSVKAGFAEYDLSHDLTTLTLDEQGAKASQLSVDLADPYKVYSHALQEGMEIEVDLGEVKDHSLVFRGHICKVDGNFPKEGVPTLKLLAYDRLTKMGLRKHNRVWTGMYLSDIITEIGRAYFDQSRIDVDVLGDPTFSGNGIRQQNETDLAFLLRLGSIYGCELYVSPEEKGDALHCVSEYYIMTTEPEVTVYHGRCNVANRLISFQASSDVSKIQLPKVFAGVDYQTGNYVQAETREIKPVGSSEDSLFDENLSEFKKNNAIKAEQLEALLSSAVKIRETLIKELGGVEREVMPTFTTEADLKIKAENQFATSIQGMQASGTVTGNHRIRAQTGINIANVGGRFSGVWYLSQVRHTLNGQGYQTEFQCQR